VRIEYTFHYLIAFRSMHSHTSAASLFLKICLHISPKRLHEAIALCAQRKSAIDLSTDDCSLRQLSDCSWKDNFSLWRKWLCSLDIFFCFAV